MSDRPRISIVTPTHQIPETEFFLNRLKASLDKQTFRDFDHVITNEGKMAENTNRGIKQATGEIIKILYMDDYLYNEDALQHIADGFEGGWLVTGCVHDDGEIHNEHYPIWNPSVRFGYNTIGSPSVIAFENNDPILCDETLSWLIDCDWYDRLYKRYGEPTIIPFLDVVIGLGKHQTSHTMTDEEKYNEYKYMLQKP